MSSLYGSNSRVSCFENDIKALDSGFCSGFEAPGNSKQSAPPGKLRYDLSSAFIELPSDSICSHRSTNAVSANKQSFNFRRPKVSEERLKIRQDRERRRDALLIEAGKLHVPRKDDERLPFVVVPLSNNDYTMLKRPPRLKVVQDKKTGELFPVVVKGYEMHGNIFNGSGTVPIKKLEKSSVVNNLSIESRIRKQSYDGLRDPNLKGFFTDPKVRAHLIAMGLLTDGGQIVSTPEEYWEGFKCSQEMTRQMEIKKRLEVKQHLLFKMMLTTARKEVNRQNRIDLYMKRNQTDELTARMSMNQNDKQIAQNKAKEREEKKIRRKYREETKRKEVEMLNQEEEERLKAKLAFSKKKASEILRYSRSVYESEGNVNSASRERKNSADERIPSREVVEERKLHGDSTSPLEEIEKCISTYESRSSRKKEIKKVSREPEDLEERTRKEEIIAEIEKTERELQELELSINEGYQQSSFHQSDAAANELHLKELQAKELAFKEADEEELRQFSMEQKLIFEREMEDFDNFLRDEYMALLMDREKEDQKRLQIQEEKEANRKALKEAAEAEKRKLASEVKNSKEAKRRNRILKKTFADSVRTTFRAASLNKEFLGRFEWANLVRDAPLNLHGATDNDLATLATWLGNDIESISWSHARSFIAAILKEINLISKEEKTVKRDDYWLRWCCEAGRTLYWQPRNGLIVFSSDDLPSDIAETFETAHEDDNDDNDDIYDVDQLSLFSSEEKQRMTASSVSAEIEQPRQSMFPELVPAANFMRSMIEVIFDMADIDNSGTIEYKELILLLRSPTLGIEVSDEDIQAVLHKYDTDEDGNISFDEFLPLCVDIFKRFYQARDSSSCQWVELHSQVTGTFYFSKISGFATHRKPVDFFQAKQEDDLIRYVVKDIFEKADIDRDGLLNDTEFALLLLSPSLNLNMSESEIVRTRQYHQSSEGRISLAEFDPLCRRLIVHMHRNSTTRDWIKLHTVQTGVFFYSSSSGKCSKKMPDSMRII